MKGEGATRADLRRQLLLAAAAVLTVGVLFAAEPVAASQDVVTGIDISHYQGQPRWGKVSRSGIRFVIAKATEGTTFTDPQYARNRARAAALGLGFTAYHFAQPDRSRDDAVKEADHFLKTAALDAKNLLPVLDLERTGGLASKRLVAWVKAWLAEVEATLGVKPMIYTSPSFWIENMADSRWFADHGYRLWVAHWTSASEPATPAKNWGGQGWTFWQHGSCVSVDGISGCVDQDVYNGFSLKPLRIGNNL